MGLSSNARYQLVNGFEERVLASGSRMGVGCGGRWGANGWASEQMAWSKHGLTPNECRPPASLRCPRAAAPPPPLVCRPLNPTTPFPTLRTRCRCPRWPHRWPPSSCALATRSWARPSGWRGPSSWVCSEGVRRSWGQGKPALGARGGRARGVRGDGACERSRGDARWWRVVGLGTGDTGG